MGGKSLIRSIFFAQFHPTAGPQLLYQVPDDVISRDQFDSIHVYVIAKDLLQNRFISVDVDGLKVIGCPVNIQRSHYARNALTFNMCLVVSNTTNNNDVIKYELIVRKLAYYLNTLECEDEFLSRDESKQRLPEIMKEIRDGLNEQGTCHVSINEFVTIHLQLWTDTTPCGTCPSLLDSSPACVAADDLQRVTAYRGGATDDWPRVTTSRGGANDKWHRMEPCDSLYPCGHIMLPDTIMSCDVQGGRYGNNWTVKEEDVPVLINDFRLSTLNKLSIAHQQVLSYIDGVSHVSKIAAEADMDINIVIHSISYLLEHAMISVTPILEYSNVYMTRPEVHRLVKDKRLQEEVIKYISTHPRRPARIRDILESYSFLVPDNNVKLLCVQLNPAARGIDVRRLIEFGLRRHLIYRLHQYSIRRTQPVNHNKSSFNPAPAGSSISGSSNPAHIVSSNPGSSHPAPACYDVEGMETESLRVRIEPFLTGEYSHDHICSKLGISKVILHEVLQQDNDIVTFYR